MIRRAGCAELAELRSAFVDQALADRDRERLLSHLVDCADCRADVDDLRRVRQLLSAPQPRLDAPVDLSSRLISIAAVEPARRHRRPASVRTVRVVAASAVLVLLVSSLALVGYVAAPATTTAVRGDPSADAVSEFGGMLASLPLTNQSVGAMAAIRPTVLSAAPAARAMTPSGVARELTAAQARQRLAAAARTPNRISFAGVQSYRAVRGDQQVAAAVEVVNVAGEGTEMVVRDAAGRELQSQFVRGNAASRLSELTLVSLLAENYTLAGWPGSEVAGRRATVIEARDRGHSTPGRLAGRWWVDDATDLVLWQETYAADGRVQSAAGFSSVRFGAQADISDQHTSSIARTTTSLTLAKTGDLAAQGWSPPRTLAGLPLVRLRSDRARDPQVLHLVYSDGLSVLSVFEQRGGLSAAPSNTGWDQQVGAFVRWGSASTASWQSGQTTLTVVSNGSPELVAAAVRALPHEPGPKRTTMETILAGWGRIFGSS